MLIEFKTGMSGPDYSFKINQQVESTDFFSQEETARLLDRAIAVPVQKKIETATANKKKAK